MKAFFITRHIPSKTGGGGIATLAFLNSVLEICGSDVYLFVADAFDDTVLTNKIDNIYRQGQRSFFKRIFGVLTGKITRFNIRDIAEKTERHKPDLVFLDGSIVGGSFAGFFKSLNIRTVTLYHNFEIDYHTDNKTIETLRGRFLYWIEKLEKDAYNNTETNVFFSSYDLKIFEERYGLKSNNYLLGSYEYQASSPVIFKQSLKEDKRIKLIISGTLSDLQTEKSVLSFIKNIYQTSKFPLDKVSLTIAGRKPSQNLIKICETNSILLIGSPLDMKKTLAEYDIYICPVDLGGGIKIRIMDALAVGLPCICHKVSARGYESIDSTFFKSYITRDDFITHLLEIMKLREETCNIQSLIQANYNKFFSFEAGTARLKKLLQITS